MHTTKWLSSTIGIALIILGLQCNNARAEYICFTLQYYNAVDFYCGNNNTDPHSQLCLPVAGMHKAAYMSCSQSSGDPSKTWFGREGGCASVTHPAWLGGRFPCSPQLNSSGLASFELTLNAGYVTTVGVLVDPDKAVAWLGAIAAYYAIDTTYTYFQIINCTQSSAPSRNYWRKVIQPSGLDGNNNPLYDFPSCGS